MCENRERSAMPNCRLALRFTSIEGAHWRDLIHTCKLVLFGVACLVCGFLVLNTSRLNIYLSLFHKIP